VRRSGGGAENQTEDDFLYADTEAANRTGNKIKRDHGRTWNEIEWAIEASRRSNGLNDWLEQRMKSDGPFGATVIGQTRHIIEQQK
jgi:hypothetical protein